MFASARAIRNILKPLQNATKLRTNAQGVRHIRDVQSQRPPSNSQLVRQTKDLEPPDPTSTPSDLDAPLEFGQREAHVPTFNLAAHVNSSNTLQQLLSLGVDLHSIERRKGLGQFVLELEFDKNVKPVLTFLVDQGVSASDFGQIISKNPLLFKVDLDVLQTRVEYLKSKNFTDEARSRILTQNPYWLMFSTRRVDRRLGFFQKEFRLSGSELRLLATREPNVITYSMENLRKSIFTLREEMGFSGKELSHLVVKKPRLMMIPPDDLVERFSYIYNTMGLSHSAILQNPELLASREFRLRERHEFLQLLGRAQYDPKKDLYVAPKTIVLGNNFYFVRNVAKSDIQTFDLFLKTR
ncbi:uncharacterized protein Dwil_GK12335 [Drosophila willistoni]|uniref:Transcription termination factor 3, mitochondrial n=1 Tax=Drosophila willistoni TaxID=7260 RepID=B4N6L2_DROWI|nr:transcription termination factor 3, mitochondrial [Drosophila willistoni]EDW80001.1 uncharacterized protein Dwil_GK12335 [Drosophila willistoni]